MENLLKYIFFTKAFKVNLENLRQKSKYLSWNNCIRDFSVEYLENISILYVNMFPQFLQGLVTQFNENIFDLLSPLICYMCASSCFSQIILSNKITLIFAKRKFGFHFHHFLKTRKQRKNLVNS